MPFKTKWDNVHRGSVFLVDAAVQPRAGSSHFAGEYGVADDTGKIGNEANVYIGPLKPGTDLRSASRGIGLALADHLTLIGFNSANKAGITDAVAIGGATVSHSDAVALGNATVTTDTGQVNIGAHDLEVTDATKGVVLVAPNKTRYRVTVDNSGALQVAAA
jgi:hypothetical protein